MDYIVNEPSNVYDWFFENFNDVWSRPEQASGFRAYTLGLISETHRKNIEAMSAKIIQQEYQSLHHFLAESPWDASMLNRRRIEILMQEPKTAACDKGILIIDDTGVPKKGRSTEGVKRQYIGEVGKVANGQVFVTSEYADKRCHWPVEIAPYVPDTWLAGGKENPAFRNKIELGLELVDRARAAGIRFRAVVADCWYGNSVNFITALEQRELPYVVELKASQRMFARLPGDLASCEHRLKEALRLLKREDFRPVRLKNADGTEREVWIARLQLKLKKLRGKRRVIIVTTRPDDPGADEDLRFVTTNAVQLRDATVAELYALRNWVEVFYKEAKDDLGAGQYQVRDLESILRHFYLVFVAYALLVLLKRKGDLARWCKKNSTPSDKH